MKKYLVVKMAEGWSQVVNWVVMPGLYTIEAAQQFVDSAMADEPGRKVHDPGSGSGVILVPSVAREPYRRRFALMNADQKQELAANQREKRECF